MLSFPFFSCGVFVIIQLFSTSSGFSTELKLPLSAAGHYPSAILNVLDYGAIADNKTLNTLFIDAAIQDAAKMGGAIVYFPKGAYYTGGLNLSSNTYLYFQDGAFLQASNNFDDYSFDWDLWDVIHAENVSNCGIIGEGEGSVIAGPMWQMIEYYDPVQNQLHPVIWTDVRGCQGECRPRGIVFVDAVNVTISSFWLRDSADWSSLFRRCDNLLIDRVKISGTVIWPNNDGIDLESGRNITLSNLDISTGDDGVVFSSGNTNNMNHRWPEEAPYTPLRDVVVRNSRIQSHSCAMKFEAIFQEEHGDIFDVLIENIDIYGSNRGIGFQQRTGSGVMSDIVIRNVSIETLFITGTNWWGAGEGLYVSSIPEGPSRVLGGIRDVLFEHVRVVSESMAFVSSRDQKLGLVTDITFRDVSYTVAQFGNETSPRHDYRPLDSDSKSEQSYDAKVDGFFLENVVNIYFKDSSVSFKPPVQPYWNNGACVNSTSESIAFFENFECFFV